MNEISDQATALKALRELHIVQRLQYHESDTCFDYDFDGQAVIAEGVMEALMKQGLVAFQIAMFGDATGDYVLTDYALRKFEQEGAA